MRNWNVVPDTKDLDRICRELAGIDKHTFRQITVDETLFGSDLIKEYAIALIKAGYRVYGFSFLSKQIFFENTDCQLGSLCSFFSSVNFSSVHKPCREHGNGFQTFDNISGVNLGYANSSCKALKPNWSSAPICEIKKWDSFADMARGKRVDYFEIVE